MHGLNESQHRTAAIPPETGKLAVVTASTSGIGFKIALALAQAGADVIVTGRNSADGHEALRQNPAGGSAGTGSF